MVIYMASIHYQLIEKGEMFMKKLFSSLVALLFVLGLLAAAVLEVPMRLALLAKVERMEIVELKSRLN